MADRLQVAMVAAEAAPFAKTGGLADVIGALPCQLEQLGVSVSVIIPRYRIIDLNRFGFKPCPLENTIPIPLGFEHLPFDVHVANLPNTDVQVFLIGNDRFFDREGIYLDVATGKDYPDQADRWIFFQHAAMEFLRVRLPNLDILHCHDHQTGLMPGYMEQLYRPGGAFGRTSTVFTIHNMGYQGVFARDIVARAGFRVDEFYFGSPFEFYGGLNFMKVGVSLADIVTTVSETYAREIRESGEFGYGLEGVLRNRRENLVGILNGIDDEAWNPAADPYIPARFTPQSLEGKATNRKALLDAVGLDASRLDRPVMAMISRIEVQKGFDLTLGLLDDLLSQDVYFVLLGAGNAETENALREIAGRHTDRAALRFTYDNELAHLIEAGSDIFLMPSKYEPCGLNQMYSMRYGTVPVVRATGGLADTVTEFDPVTGLGTGFRFTAYRPEAFRQAIDRALQFWKQPEAWRRIMVNGMIKDFSWTRSARKYIDIYERVRRR